MFRISILLSALLLLLLSKPCQAQVVEKIAKQAVVVNDFVERNDFGFLSASLEGKDIIILGEAAHGDGKTFEVKSNMVEWLIQHHGFNAIALEARDFFEMEFINGRTSLEQVFDSETKEDWMRNWAPWGRAKEIEKLVEVLSTNKLGIVGVENYNYASAPKVLEYLQKSLESKGINFWDVEKWITVKGIDSRMHNQNEISVSEVEYQLYIEDFSSLLSKTNSLQAEDLSFIKQIVENVITYARMQHLNSMEMTDKVLNQKINIRDAQMARNLIWYKERNPNAKIIVWMANFHGAKKISDVEYLPYDSDDGIDFLRYNKFTLFGEHISNAYKELVFSLAFTSSRGRSKMPYDFEGIEDIQIIAPEGSLEKQLELKKNWDFGFVDFMKIKQEFPELANNEFYSIMLGYANQKGKWLNVFDGLFYIRENYRATPME